MSSDSFTKSKESLENFFKNKISFKDNTVIKDCCCFYSNNVYEYEGEDISYYLGENIKGFLKYLDSLGRSNGQYWDRIEVCGKEKISMEYFPILILWESNDFYNTTNCHDYDIFDVEPFNIVISVSYKNINENKIFKASECVICYVKEPNILFFNCGHLCTCEDCIEHLDNPKLCLMCRKKNNIVRKI